MVCLTIYLLSQSLVISNFWILEIKSLWTIAYGSLHGLKFLFLWDKGLEVQLLSGMVSVCLVLWGTARLFSMVVVPFYISNSIVWQVQFPCLLASIWCYHLFSWSNRCVVIAHCNPNLHFPNGWWCRTSFMCLFVIRIYFSKKYCFMSFAFLIGLFFSLSNFKCSLHILDMNSLSDTSFANIFSRSVLIFSFSQ